MATWKLDITHSEVNFKVKHLVISTVTGSFKSFEATVEATDDTFANANIAFSADVNSIDTNNEQRDGHLKSPDFFDAAAFPTLSFESKSFSPKGNDSFDLAGVLTIKGVSKEVKLKVTYGGTVQDPYGQTKAGFELEGKISRKEFGLTWSAVTEAGSVVVGDEITLLANVQVVKQA